MKQKLFFLFFLFFTSYHAGAQNDGPAVGEWKAMNCYYTASTATFHKGKIYCGTGSGMFVYDHEDEMSTPFSKVSGMADVGIVKIAADNKTGKVVIAYENANIDIFENGKFSNVPDIKNSTISGDKTITHLIAFDGMAYASTSIGLIVINIEKKEIAYTVTFFEGSSKAAVYSSAVFGTDLYAATSHGLMRIHKDDKNKQDYTRWNRVSERQFSLLTANDNGFYGLLKKTLPTEFRDSVFKLDVSGTATFFYATERVISSINMGKNKGLWLGEEYKDAAGAVKFLNESAVPIKSAIAFFPGDILELTDGSVFFPDNDLTKANGGLRKINTDGKTISFTPDGPESPFCTDVWAYDGEVWLAHGGYTSNWSFIGHTKAFSTYRNKQWLNFSNHVNSLGVSLLSDASVVFKDRNSGNVYVGMAAGGLIEVSPQDEIKLIQNPYLGMFGSLYVVSGITTDAKGNLWLNNYGADKEIRMQTPQGEWYAFHPMAAIRRMSHSMIIDDHNNKWMAVVSGGGVVVYNEQGTYDDPSDDVSRLLQTGNGNGNLPSSEVLCLAKDKNNAVWIGTNDGIAIADQPSEVLAGNKDANIRIVQYGDEPAGALFKGKVVKSIAVDGSNKKWIGTDEAGAWLISENGDAVIHHFDVHNSPLPSNEINSIDIDPVTGDVYFSTGKGLVVFRGDATELKSNSEQQLLIYPNPVPSGFSGMIAIDGLVSRRSEVRILDVAGQLIAQFSAEGGQAVWDGKDYTGRRPQTGVYVVLVTDKSSGKTVQSGKFIFNE